MSQNGDQQVRHQVMAYARNKARDLALQGLSAHEIVAHIDGGGLNETERDLLRRIVSQEVTSTGTEVVSPSPGRNGAQLVESQEPIQ